jgi:hypothetical protein
VTKLAAVFALAFSVAFTALAARIPYYHASTGSVMDQSVGAAPLFSSLTDGSDKQALSPQRLDNLFVLHLSSVLGCCFVGLCLFRLFYLDQVSRLHYVRSIPAIASSADIHRYAPRISQILTFTPPLDCGLIFLQHHLVFNNIPICRNSPRTALPNSIVGMPNIFNRFSKLPTTLQPRNSLFAAMFIIVIPAALKVLVGYAAMVRSWSQLRFASPREETFGALSSMRCASGEIGLLLGRVLDSYVSFKASASKLVVAICPALAPLWATARRLYFAFVQKGKSVFRRPALHLDAFSVWLVRWSLGWLDKFNDATGITASALAISASANGSASGSPV